VNYGLQLYSVRDLSETDLHGALRQAAGLGYQAIEFAGFFGHPADEVKAWLDSFGLRASGTHTSLNALENDFDAVVRYHHAIGCPLLIVPFAKPGTLAEMEALAAKLTECKHKLTQEGIALAYHNHAHEFKPVEKGISFWDTLTAYTALPLELDTYWVYAAGEDPVRWMEKLHRENRLPVIHIKDGFADGGGKPLGHGTAPVEAVYRAAVRLGVPMVVESETMNPSGMEEARVCIEYLKKLEGT
jgi:sugar phosphate isomerase/epimerase